MTSMIDAVADPVRARLVRRLPTNGPASLDELATAAGIHANTARAHLQALTAEGFVQRDTQPAGVPGRPRTLFSLRDDWTAPDEGFLAMAELLGAALGATKPDTRALRRLGARWGPQAGPPGPGPAWAPGGAPPPPGAPPPATRKGSSPASSPASASTHASRGTSSSSVAAPAR